MKDKILKQAEHEYSPGKRLVALLIEGVFFLGVLPFTLVYLSSLLDARFDVQRFEYGSVNVVTGLFFVVLGVLLAFWSIYVQFTLGRGTPVPVMATQELIVQRPYGYCRNPMALGAIGLYFGVAVFLGSISAVALVIVGAIILLTYIKLLEEKEMEMRFGEAYQEYRKRTPFIIPRFWRR